jgi:AcrR family transcriptional regulator
VAARRMGAEDSATRALLLDVTEQIMVEGGYAAVSSRKVAEAAGVKPPLVHYYFATMDDLFLAVFRRLGESGLAAQADVLSAPDPVRAMWAAVGDPQREALNFEFVALANHRPKVKAEIARYAELFRVQQAEAMARVLPAELVSPLAAAVFMTCVSRTLLSERALGVTLGHPETLALVEQLLTQLDEQR